jgi:polyhydroxyalkanoic acid synthase PhaR subunit
MTKEEKPEEPADSNAWKKSMDGDKETSLDPYGLYRAWLKSVGEAQEQIKPSSMKMFDPKEVWQHWFEATTAAWRNAAEKGADPLGLTTQWSEMMEEARAKISAEGTIAADPFTLFKQWYDATSETWSKAVGDIIGSDRFMQMASQFLESYTSFARTFHRASEEYFSNLQLPTRSDIARVAELVINVEEKVDQLDLAFEGLEDTYAQSTTSEAIAGLAGRLDGVENKLDVLPAVLQKLATVERLEMRLDRVENKLDQLLLALEKIEATPQAVRSTNSTRKSPGPRSGSAKGQAGKAKV